PVGSQRPSAPDPGGGGSGGRLTEAAQQRPGHGRDPPRRGEDPVDVPAERLGQRQQPQRLGGGGAVDNQRVGVAGLVVAVDVDQAEQLVQAGDDRQLLG